MGSFDPKAGYAPPCEGEDVLGQLNAVFGNPDSDRYKKAKSQNKFGAIPNAPGNHKALIDAYEYAGLDVSNKGWVSYLRALGRVRSANPEQGPQNIYDIAQFRDRCLKNDLGMRTIIHQPHDGGHVHTKPGMGIDPEIVDSPFPLPVDEEKPAKKPPAKKKPAAKKKPPAKKSAKASAKKKPASKKSKNRAAKKSSAKKRPAKKSSAKKRSAKKSKSKKRR